MDLQDGLKELDRAAGDAVVGVPTPPSGDLWERGERWQRRRRRGSLAVAVLGAALLVALSAVTFQRAEAPEPAVSPGSAPTLPDRVYDVPAWGPMGTPGEPVVAAQLTPRSSWSGAQPAIAVLTGTGRYLFLDVDGVSGQGTAALSPDGRRVAYWSTGAPDGSPYTGAGDPVTGVAVVDVVTGEVERHVFTTEHGLVPRALLWSDAQTLIGAREQWSEGDGGLQQGASVVLGGWAWTVGGDGGPAAFDFPTPDSFTEASANRILVGRDLVDLGSGESRRVPRKGLTGSTGSAGSNAVLRADGTLVQIGGPGLGGRVPNQVTITHLDDPESAQVVVPGTKRTFQVLGWRGPDHLVVAQLAVTDQPAGSDGPDYALKSLDTASGESEVLTTGDLSMLSWSWAEDLLAAPVVDGVEPADPMDPRRVAALGLTLVVGTVGGLVLWRRRARP